jgi:hypothetical protein
LNTAIQSLLLISVVAIFTGCQTTKQNYEIVRTEDLNLTNIERSEWVINSYEKYRMVTLANWACYVPDENPEETFFCADRGVLATFITGKRTPLEMQANKYDHQHQEGDDHPHHD